MLDDAPARLDPLRLGITASLAQQTLWKVTRCATRIVDRRARRAAPEVPRRRVRRRRAARVRRAPEADRRDFAAADSPKSILPPGRRAASRPAGRTPAGSAYPS